MQDNNRVTDCPENLSSQLKPVYTITSSLSKISFNIVGPFRQFAKAVIFIFEFTELNLKRTPIVMSEVCSDFPHPSRQILGLRFKFVHDHFVTHFVKAIIHCYPYTRLYAWYFAGRVLQYVQDTLRPCGGSVYRRRPCAAEARFESQVSP